MNFTIQPLWTLILHSTVQSLTRLATTTLSYSHYNSPSKAATAPQQSVHTLQYIKHVLNWYFIPDSQRERAYFMFRHHYIKLIKMERYSSTVSVFSNRTGQGLGHLNIPPWSGRQQQVVCCNVTKWSGTVFCLTNCSTARLSQLEWF